MLPFATRGRGEPVLVLMAYLGGSYREWTAVTDRLHEQFRCVGVDLPGFGDAADVPGYSLEEMAEAVADTLFAADLPRFVLVGHSMSAKVAAVLARMHADHDARLRHLEALILVAPSPPCSEPITDRRRAQMLKALGTEPAADERARERDREAAEQFLRDNTAGDLTPEAMAGAVADVQRMHRAAWRAWLETGSREDWSARVGILGLPVLVVAGDRDTALGPDAQRLVSMPHWPFGRLATLHSNHLVPLEKPAELARLIAEFAGALGDTDPVRPPRREIEVDPAYQALIASDRVSAATRSVLDRRAEPDDPLRAPEVFTIAELTTLRSLVDRVIPQRKPAIDLAARIDAALAEGLGDGWRYAVLPPDAEAWRAGLATLDWPADHRAGKRFLAIEAGEKDEILAEAAAGTLGAGLLTRLEAAVGFADEGPRLDAAAMKRWFEEVRAEATGHYVSHPATLAAMGYSGIADGADAATQQGFVQLGIGVSEPWEPRAKPIR